MTDTPQNLPARKPGRLLVMTAGGANPRVMINALKAHWPDLAVIEEAPETKGEILRRRALRLGWPQALGQLGTMIASRLGKNIAARRTAEILREYGLSDATDPAIPVTHVTSLNSEQCIAAVSAFAPDVIFTISCRILKPATLAALPCPVINFHAGINPAYRGQMGGYWSLVENDRENFGATVHLVDAGVDTGGTLYEKRVTPAASDSLSTYPLLLTAAATDIAIAAIDDAMRGELHPKKPEGRSVLRFPPAVWTWLFNGLSKGIW